jgi:DedD protein
VEAALKQRLVGAAVLIALAVIFLPVVLDGSGYHARLEAPAEVPPEPAFHRPLPSRPQDGAGQGVSPPARGGSRAGEVRPLPGQGGEAGPPQTREGAAEPVATGWVVQVGSFSHRDNAVAERERLRAAGFPAFLERTEAEGRVLHRVKVGPELDRRAAERLKERLEETMERSGILVQHP